MLTREHWTQIISEHSNLLYAIDSVMMEPSLGQLKLFVIVLWALFASQSTTKIITRIDCVITNIDPMDV